MNGKNIFQRMAAITAEIQTVAKNLDVSTGGGKSYKAVSERDVIDAVKPIEAKHGVYSYPVCRTTEASELLETETEYQGKVTRKTTFYSRIKTVYRFVNIDNPEDFIETEVFSVGIDPQDKGDGKAMTYGDKYALMKAYKISTGDDPDQNPSEEKHYDKPKPVIGGGKDFIPTCADCGKEISDKVHDFSVKKYGRPLCMECQKNAN